MKHFKKRAFSALLCLTLAFALSLSAPAAQSMKTVKAAKAQNLNASIKGFMKAAKSFDVNKMERYIYSWGKTTEIRVASQSQSHLKAYYKKCARKLNYKIISQKTKGNTAKVKFRFNYVNAYEFVENTVMLIVKDALTGIDVSSMLPRELLKYSNSIYKKSGAISPIKKMRTQNVTVTFIRTGSCWKIKKMTKNLENVLAANALASAEQIQNSMN